MQKKVAETQYECHMVFVVRKREYDYFTFKYVKTDHRKLKLTMICLFSWTQRRKSNRNKWLA